MIYELRQRYWKYEEYTILLSDDLQFVRTALLSEAAYLGLTLQGFREFERLFEKFLHQPQDPLFFTCRDYLFVIREAQVDVLIGGHRHGVHDRLWNGSFRSS